MIRQFLISLGWFKVLGKNGYQGPKKEDFQKNEKKTSMIRPFMT